MPALSVKGYIIALPEVIKTNSETYTYRDYVTESLRMQGENMYFKESWASMVDTTPPPPQDERPCEEIAHDIFSRIRGENRQ